MLDIEVDEFSEGYLSDNHVFCRKNVHEALSACGLIDLSRRSFRPLGYKSVHDIEVHVACVMRDIYLIITFLVTRSAKDINVPCECNHLIFSYTTVYCIINVTESRYSGESLSNITIPSHEDSQCSLHLFWHCMTLLALVCR